MNTDPPDSRDREPRRRLEDPRNVNRALYALYGACGVLLVADAFYAKHPHFDIENVFGFYGIFGFIACVGLVLAARLLRRLLKREEDYYDG